jgi:hypothetical protein
MFMEKLRAEPAKGSGFYLPEISATPLGGVSI